MAFERVGLWNVSFASNNPTQETMLVAFALVAGTAEQAVAGAREILATLPTTLPASKYVLFEVVARPGGVFLPLADDEGKKKAPATPEGGEGNVLRMVPKVS